MRVDLCPFARGQRSAIGFTVRQTIDEISADGFNYHSKMSEGRRTATEGDREGISGRKGRTEGEGEKGHEVVIIYGREQSAALRASRSGNLTR